mmetsp:Transcript_10882/g.16391  ORF Transcript_10882/g.16391 Transcript_10882/m.16391 type:complete len:1680 (-) Transcript_10882:1413-6452(-)|eukprot:CAMPEP_0197308404 /NCGR_PEP_ID=MMETSP0891-20130614/6756_1 /TAXON_ID=44058 ORGANISM="Aureoumbra lagunensis, Strain CCMP1510" /NCGR_SAMPLE_ID=MMETSP0891 /ASSEMBLY_ACC=CAM_ASM_000534 /LENGTH=1679 /DNA_ID=CAMNT_0042792759 /DNA_START=46 /DNA_END=5085 /DNA_ORIENTATION=+
MIGQRRVLVIFQRRLLSTRIVKEEETLIKSTSSSSTFSSRKQALYDPAQERDSCGVGLVANLKGIQTRQTVLDCNEMLVRMSHRGGCGCDPKSGDGAGMLVGMPDSFMRSSVKASLGTELPKLGEYAVGMMMLPREDELAQEARSSIERIAKRRGLGIIGWRNVPVDNSELGEAPLQTEPIHEQLFLRKPGSWDETRFKRELYRVQRLAEAEAFANKIERGLEEAQMSYISSLSPYSLTYKGQLTPEQVLSYFCGDLLDANFETHVALVHSRFSTNTFPSWSRAQPLRLMCHNGEINTLRGNKNWMRARTNGLDSPYYGYETAQLLPVTSDDMSDSGNFDGVLQLLTTASDRSLPETAMMMVPEAWQDNDSLTPTKKAFYEYNSALMEPWDGPALIAFTDAHKFCGATLDRNGLRPARYYVTRDDRVLVSSEVGVLPQVPQDAIAIRARLEPGKMFLLDFEEGRIVPDDEIKERISASKPYDSWIDQRRTFLSDWVREANTESSPTQNQQIAFPEDPTVATRRLVMHGYTTETMETLLAPMAIGAKEGLGSMGNDAALAVLSLEPRPVYDYFKQLFAQVTNPPIDPIREELVMSLVCPVGPEANVLKPSAENCARLVVEHPVLTTAEFESLIQPPTTKTLSSGETVPLKTADGRQWRAATLDTTFTVNDKSSMLSSRSRNSLTYHHDAISEVLQEGNGDGASALETALRELCEHASAAVTASLNESGALHRHQHQHLGGCSVYSDDSGEGASIIILSDALAGPGRIPVPSLLAVGAVHQHLLRTGQRGKAAIFVDSGDAKEVHDMALLLGFGCDGIYPRVAYQALAKLRADGLVGARMRNLVSSPDDVPDDDALAKAYRKALAKGVLKVMSKMGISTLQSYKGAQIFEALGLHPSVVDFCFAGTPSRIGGAGFEALQADAEFLHAVAWNGYSPKYSIPPSVTVEPTVPRLPNPGQFHYRNAAEAHLNTPKSMVYLQEAARRNSHKAFEDYSKEVNKSNQACTLRGLLRWRPEALAKGARSGIKLDDVEPTKEIVKRFVTGAMSLGSISQEAHEALAVAMNSLGGRSNTGEGGEDPIRFEDNRRSSIKQVASGRFGVTSHYLANSDQIQIKMAQGAKPGEGGELPGYKVSEYIAQCRGTTPGVGLISPPPHHDIYSIEDLAQLIHDLKCANPQGQVSVKLVSEVGVGVVAAGVAKAKSDHIVVSGGDGGTGAAAWTGIKCAGLPWELGVAETQQTLVLNGLRDRVRLQTDGQLKTARDVAIAAALGAEEFAFSTGPLIALGCIMMRKCHLNTCPVGIATQDPELRAKFEGQPEHVINFFWLLAEEIRGILSNLGMRSMDELIGTAGEVLEVDPLVLRKNGRPDKTRGLDLAPLLQPARELNPSAGLFKVQDQDHELEKKADVKLIEQVMPMIDAYANGKPHEPIELDFTLTNIDRTFGTMLSSVISKRLGIKGLPDDSVTINLHGSTGQSLGFTLAPGITIRIHGDANDGCAKGLSGGKVIVRPANEQLEVPGFIASDNVIVGNVACYGATNGEVFFRGKAGERFCVRNSGALAVVEGVGDHGCEYMTGGRVVCLGSTGRNFAAGMSGGIAYIYDPHAVFSDKCNPGMVKLTRVPGSEDEEELKSYIQKHYDATNSDRAKSILDSWDSSLEHFVRVMPYDYERVLKERAAIQEKQQEMAA